MRDARPFLPGNPLRGFAASRDARRRPAGHPVAVTLRCVIVDDSPHFLDAARGLLERQGMAVVGVASTSQEALQRVEELRPDVTLVDIDLGGESGFELARRLNHQSGPARSAVILISTHAEQDYADLIAASPAIGFLPKATLSADAIRDLLASRGDGDPGTLLSGPSGL
jgi:DNA-binding NarL/FixJ family response regulator